MLSEKMRSAVEGLPSVSAKIRKLDAEGYSRTEIARLLGKKYQHVRNVLIAEQKRANALASADRTTTERVEIVIGPGGRIVIPAAFRAEMQVAQGDVLMARLVDGEMKLISPAMAVRRAQKLVREYIPGNDSLADDLIRARVAEVEQETSS